MLGRSLRGRFVFPAWWGEAGWAERESTIAKRRCDSHGGISHDPARETLPARYRSDLGALAAFQDHTQAAGTTAARTAGLPERPSPETRVQSSCGQTHTSSAGVEVNDSANPVSTLSTTPPILTTPACRRPAPTVSTDLHVSPYAIPIRAPSSLAASWGPGPVATVRVPEREPVRPACPGLPAWAVLPASLPLGERASVPAASCRSR